MTKNGSDPALLKQVSSPQGGFTFNDLMGGRGEGGKRMGRGGRIVEKERSCWNQKILWGGGGQCGGSGMSRIPDPDFYPSRIPDPKTATKERGGKKIVVIPFL